MPSGAIMLYSQALNKGSAILQDNLTPSNFSILLGKINLTHIITWKILKSMFLFLSTNYIPLMSILERRGDNPGGSII